MMTKGMEHMIKALIGMLGLNPQIIESHIVGIGKSLHNAAAEMAALRRQNHLIMAHLGIADPITKEEDHERHNAAISGPPAGTA